LEGDHHGHDPETKVVGERRALKAEALAKAVLAKATRARAAVDRAALVGTPDDQPSTSNRNNARPGKKTVL